MTVVAWHKTKGVAVDGQGTMGDICNDVVKFYKHTDGLFVGCGRLNVIQEIYHNIENDKPVKPMQEGGVWFVKFDEKGKATELHHVTQGRYPDCLEQERGLEFRAMGSGAPYAITAMGMGKSPKEAVELACRLDVHCGGDIAVFNAKGVKAK